MYGFQNKQWENKLNFMINNEYFKVYNDYLQNPNNTNCLDGFASHQPILVELLKRIEKPKVIELGIGYGSTPIITELSHYSEHYETDNDWLDKFISYQNENHKFFKVSNVGKLDGLEMYNIFEWKDNYIFEKEWDIAFIDNAPGESRQTNLLKLANKCKFIICHDTEELYKLSAGNYQWDFSNFKYQYVFDKYNVYTTVVSNFEDFKL